MLGTPNGMVSLKASQWILFIDSISQPSQNGPVPLLRCLKARKLFDKAIASVGNRSKNHSLLLLKAARLKKLEEKSEIRY